MKKIIIAMLLASMLVSGTACTGRNSGSGKESATMATTVVTTADPATVPVVITLDDINSVIKAAKAEYDSATAEITLSDKTVLSTEVKDPGVSVETIENGTATYEQMSSYAVYLAGVRKLVADRLKTAYTVGNTVDIGKDDNGNELGTFIFMDPAKAGYKNAVDLIVAVSDKKNENKPDADFVHVQNGTVSYFNNSTSEAVLLYPAAEENAILMAIAATLNPDMLTEKVTEPSAVTE